MRHVMLAIGAAVLVIVALALWIDAGEVLTLETTDASGQIYRTELWVVEHEGAIFVRGERGARWLQRVRKQPEVKVLRAGREGAYRAQPIRDPEVVAAVESAMGEKYGLAERLFGHLFGDTARVAVRLEPRIAVAPHASGLRAAESTP